MLKGLLWKRPKEIYGDNYELFAQNNSNFQLNQGILDDNYFLSVVSAFTYHKLLFQTLFLIKEKNEKGIYQVKLIKEGIVKIVTIDDYFPCHSNSKFWAFSTTLNKEIWLQVLEKAWAKLNGSYVSILPGTALDALRTLSEAPCELVENNTYKREDLWNLLKTSVKNKFVVVCQPYQEDMLDLQGLVSHFVYYILNVYDLQNGLGLIKFGNHSSSFDWKGDYSSYSKTWTPELMKQVNFSKNDKDSFYMSYDDFIKHFSFSYILKYRPNYFYNFKKFEQIPPDAMCIFKINVPDNFNGTLTIHQKQKRFCDSIPYYKPRQVNCFIAKYTQDSYEFIQGISSYDEKVEINFNYFNSGEYHILTNLNWPYKEKTCHFVVSLYSNYDVEIDLVDRNSIPKNYFCKLMLDFMKKYETPIPTLNPDLTILTNTDIKNKWISNDPNYAFKLISVRNGNMTCGYSISFTLKYDKNSLRLQSNEFVFRRKEATESDLFNFNIKDADLNKIEDDINIFINPDSEVNIIFKYTNIKSLKDINFEEDLKISDIQFWKIENKFDDYKLLNTSVIGKYRGLKEFITPDCFYFVFDSNFTSNIYLVFENLSKNSIYKLKVNFLTLKNLELVEKNISELDVNTSSFEFIKLKRQTSGEYDFSLCYSYKKIETTVQRNVT